MAEGNPRSGLRQQIEQAVEQNEEQNAPVVKREKVPGPYGSNPAPFPEGYDKGIVRGLKRRAMAASPNPTRSIGAGHGVVKLGDGVYLGDVNLAQWKERVEHHMSPEEIGMARNWYKDALPTYEKYFGKDAAPAMMGAWLIANKNVDPAGAQLNAMRIKEQLTNLSQQFGEKQKQGGLAHKELMKWWKAVLGGDMETVGRLGGQKIYDFIDSALGKNTRTYYGDDPRMGAPAVADIHSLRDMGHIDPATLKWVAKTYGAKAAAQLTKTFDGTPGEARYEWAADKMRRFADELNKEGYMGGNWTPAELQATGWMTMSKMLERAGQTAEQAIGAHVRNVSSELDFGKGSPYHEKFPGWAKLTPEQKMAVTQEVMPQAAEFARQVTGAHPFETNVALGGWRQPAQAAKKATKNRPAQEAQPAMMGYNPSMQNRLIASEEVARNYGNVLGLLAHQTQIFGYRPQENGKKFGVAVHSPGLNTPEAVTKFWDAFSAKHPDVAAGFSPSTHEDGTPGLEMLFDRGGDVMHKRVINELHPSIKQILEDQGIHESDTRPFQANIVRTGHDWETDKTGSSYAAPLAASYGPDLPARVEHFRRTTFEPALQPAIDKQLGGGAEAGAEGAPPEEPLGPQAEEQPPAGPQEGPVPFQAPEERRESPRRERKRPALAEVMAASSLANGEE